MKKYTVHFLDRTDALIAAGLIGVALLLYGRTMAPDILYGDSAELQTLAYTLGHTHSTGYPVYLFLARLVGFLPIHLPAWRVTFFSVLMGALAVAGVYLLSRLLTNSKVGASLASITLAISYTLWSQAILTEVYAPAAAFEVWILFLTLHWQQDPKNRTRSLFAAALLAGLSLGVHSTAAMAAVPAAGLVLVWLVVRRAPAGVWRQILLPAVVGMLVGLGLWLAAYLFIDWHNPPSSFFNVMLSPSRSIWNLTDQDLDSPVERIALIMKNIQWMDVWGDGGSEAANEALVDYLTGITTREFSSWFLVLGVLGLWTLFPRSPWQAGFLLASYSLVLYFVLNYHTDDQYIFFLATYLPFAAVLGVGLGSLIEAPAGWRFLARRGWGLAGSLIVACVLAGILIPSHLAERLPALKSGVASFVDESYQFPVKNLREPRLLAQMHLSPLPGNAVVLMEWRELYALGYLAYVEGKKPGIKIVEATPVGSHGEVTASMVALIHQWLAEGRPVYAEQRFQGLERNFRLAATANRFVKIFEKEP